MADPRCGSHRDLRVHRGLVQPPPPALDLAYLSPIEFERHHAELAQPTLEASIPNDGSVGSISPRAGDRLTTRRVSTVSVDLVADASISHENGLAVPTGPAQAATNGDQDEGQRVASPTRSRQSKLADTNINYKRQDVSSKPGAVHSEQNDRQLSAGASRQTGPPLAASTDADPRLGGLRAQRLEVARGSQSGSRPAAASSPSEAPRLSLPGGTSSVEHPSAPMLVARRSVTRSRCRCSDIAESWPTKRFSRLPTVSRDRPGDPRRKTGTNVRAR